LHQYPSKVFVPGDPEADYEAKTGKLAVFIQALILFKVPL